MEKLKSLSSKLFYMDVFLYILPNNKFLNKKRMKKTILSLLLLLVVGVSGFAQVTTSTISGIVKTEKGETLPGATIQVVHVPTGTKYGTSTNLSGKYVVPAVRVGGPYKVIVSFVGFNQNEQLDVNTSLGVTTNVDVVLVESSTSLKEVVVVVEIVLSQKKEREQHNNLVDENYRPSLLREQELSMVSQNIIHLVTVLHSELKILD
jgi:hypothetical protein